MLTELVHSHYPECARGVEGGSIKHPIADNVLPFKFQAMCQVVLKGVAFEKKRAACTCEKISAICRLLQ